ncbi:MAG: hypothetical protein KF775_03930 [Cyclobacteriaceae bacterium]|nr:hypothetical protein [Cyclobacteriaceae bacterium]
MDERFVAWWAERRKAGKWNYAFRHGVLLFALPVYTALELFRYFKTSAYEFSVARIVVGVLVWSILGMLSFGLIQWQVQEKRYRKLQGEEKK